MEISLAVQDAVACIGENPADLAHAQARRGLRDRGNLGLGCGQLNEEQHEEPLQASTGPHFHGEEVGGRDQFPMAAPEFFPGRFVAMLRRPFNAVPSQDLRDGGTDFQRSVTRCSARRNGPRMWRYERDGLTSGTLKAAAAGKKACWLPAGSRAPKSPVSECQSVAHRACATAHGLIGPSAAPELL
jgi:hypothetical protein